MPSMMGLPWWDAYKSPLRDEMESRLIRGIAERVRAHGLEPRIKEFRPSSDRHDVTLDVTIDWAASVTDFDQAPTRVSVRLVADWFRGTWENLTVTLNYVTAGSPEMAIFLDTARDVALYAGQVAREVNGLVPSEKKENTPAPTPAPTDAEDQPLWADLMSALKSLNFTKAECRVRAKQAFAKAPDNPTLQELINLALKKEAPVA